MNILITQSNMAYFDERQNKVMISYSEQDTFNECRQYENQPKEKRPKPELYKWLINLIDNST